MSPRTRFSLPGLLLLAALSARAAPDRAESGVPVAYVYGSVSDDGRVPAGDKPPFHQMRLDDEGPLGLSQFATALREAGFAPTEHYDADLRFDAEWLAGFRAVIFGSNQRRFSPAEAAALRAWIEAGGGAVFWSDSAFGGHYGKVGLDNPLGRDSDNDLSAQFGLRFLTDNGGGNYLVADYVEPHYLNGHRAEGGLGFRGEGVSLVRVSPPARLLAPLQAGGLGGKLKVNAVDAPFDLATDAALAIAEPGLGRVVGVFDRNTFWNAGAGTRLSHADNREFAQRLLLWATRRESEFTPAVAAASRAPAGQVRELAVSAGPDRVARVGVRVVLEGRVTRGAAAQPELAWTVVEGSSEAAAFDNHNAATEQLGVIFSAPGRYVLEFRAKRDAAASRDRVTVTVE